MTTKITNCPLNIPNGRKIFQMTRIYHIVCHSKVLKQHPNWYFCYEKKTIYLATLIQKIIFTFQFFQPDFLAQTVRFKQEFTYVDKYHYILNDWNSYWDVFNSVSTSWIKICDFVKVWVKGLLSSSQQPVWPKMFWKIYHNVLKSPNI
jgi:hypothetical protein